MLKGTSKIELFDAKTGKLVKSVQRDNLVTNAVKGLLNGISQAALAAGSSSNIRQAHNYVLNQIASEPYKKLYGGLLVFGEHIDNANANKIIPTASEMRKYIGGGYQGSSPTGSLLGSINTSESELGDGYAKFVWDFTTQQCNGNIASICLTSDVGGNGGFKIAGSADSGHEMGFLRPLGQYNMFNIRTNVTDVPGRTPLGSVSGPGGDSWVGLTKENDEYGIFWSSDNVYRKKFSLDFNQSVLKNLGRPLGAQEQLSTGTIWESGLAPVVCFDYDKIVMVNLSGSKSKVYDGLTGTATSYTPDFSGLRDEFSAVFGITLNNNAIRSKFYKGGYLYLIVFDTTPSALADKKMRLYKVNIQTGSYSSHTYTLSSSDLGTLVPDNTRQGSGTTAHMFEFNGDVYFDMNTTYYAQVNLSSGDMAVIFRRYIYASEDGKLATWFNPISSSAKTLPWFIVPETNWSSEYGCPYLFMPYLATINNQDVVLEKDNTKTMKITYTIYEQGGT